MIDFDSIWRIQDEISTVVNAVLGECIWNLAYDEKRGAIVLELSVTLDALVASDQRSSGVGSDSHHHHHCPPYYSLKCDS